MGLFDSLNNIKADLNNYFGGASSPTQKIIDDANKLKETISSESGVKNYIQTQVDAGLSKLAAPQPQDNSKIQVDGSFLAPNDPTGAKSYFGLGATTIAVLVGAFLVLRR